MIDVRRVLVIGNGYDLAHGLKTSYNDFLEFVKNFNRGNDKVPLSIEEEFYTLTCNNPFLHYFQDYTATLNTWVDFESELRRVTYIIRDFFTDPPLIKGAPYRVNVSEVSSFMFTVLTQIGCLVRKGDGEYLINPILYDPTYEVRWDNVKRKLRKDLDGLKRALIIYLKYYMPLISNHDEFCLQQLADIDPYYVISFNYTDTYMRYGITNEPSRTFHIHGDLKTEKIVLGYDDEDDTDLTLIAFKKYFQRIQYQLLRINESIFRGKSGTVRTIAHVFGMSLDKTDEDIIKQIILLAAKVIIYYRIKDNGDMSDYENKVINLIDILGKEKFLNALESGHLSFRAIENTHVSTPKLT